MRQPTVALTREPSPSIADCQLSYMERQSFDLERLRAQHQTYCAELRRLGLDVITLPAEPDLPDSMFVEDMAVIVDELAVLTTPGAPARVPEVATIAPAIAQLRATAQIAPPATLDGGDVLQIGLEIYVGLSARTNAAGVDALRALLAPHGYHVTGVELRDCLHLKSSVTALDEHSVLLNPAWVDPVVFARYTVIEIAPEEPWAANVLPIGEHVLMNAACPQTIARVEQAGYRVVALAIDEVMKAEAALTCMSLLFYRTGPGAGAKV